MSPTERGLPGALSTGAPRLGAENVRRFGARTVGPPSRAPGEEELGPQRTSYLGQSLLVTGRPAASRSDRVRRLAATSTTTGLTMRVDTRLDEVAEQLASLGEVARAIVDRYWVSEVHLSPSLDRGPCSPVDAWPVLKGVRAEGLDRSEVRLDHPVLACEPPREGQRRPVTLTMTPPQSQRRRRRRRPVVVIPDTGVGTHPWFVNEDEVRRDVSVASVGLGLDGPMNVSSPLPANPLDGRVRAYAGHGTFIAGIVRQQCPSARIEAIRVVDNEGGVHERLLINTLVALLVRQAVALTQGNADDVFDVVSLSVGYYHEEPGDESTDPVLAGVLQELGAWGVAVVASAGNDATTAPFHPASFAGQSSGLSPDRVPLVSVGALNPNGSSAHFSNSGSWVSCERAGVEVVSTVPTHLEGSAQAGQGSDHLGQDRMALDPDDFTGGFATWSGTSFAAPVFAGQLAEHLASHRRIDRLDQASSVRRGWDAVSKEIPHWTRSRVRAGRDVSAHGVWPPTTAE